MAQDMLGITNSLFGVQPTFQSDFAQGMQLAGQSATGIGTGLAYAGGRQLGRGLMGAAGVADPETASAERAKTFAKELQAQGLSMQSAEGMNALAQKLSDAGDFKAAQAAAALANQFASERAGIGLKQAQTAKALQEQRTPTSPLGKLMTERQALLDQGLSPTDPRVVAYDRAIAAEGDGKAPKVALDLGGLSQLFAKKEAEAGGKNIADQIDKAQTALAANSKVSRDIAEVERILPNAFTGQFANFSKTASKTLSGLGIPVSEKASNTETLNALFTNFVLPAVRQLPGSLAAKELDFLRQSKPEALQEPATIKRLVGLLKEDIAANRALVKRADEYRKQDKFGSLQNFNLALEQDKIYQDIQRYNALKAKVTSGQKVTKEEAEFAKKLEQDLGL